MIDWARGAIPAAAASVFAFGVDLLAFGGDVIVAGLMLVISDLDLIVSTLAYLTNFASGVEWIPAAIIEEIYLVALGMMVLVMLARVINSWRNTEE